MHSLKLSFVESITDIGKSTWNELAGIENPFTRYEFLWALEHTGCATESSGWAPQHVVVHDDSGEDKKLVALMPLYRKTNSYGEYVFDWSWAHAYQNHELNYYPKFVTAVPFTPSVGSRLFIRPGYDLHTIADLIFNSVKERAKSLRASSWHVLFPVETQHEALAASGMLRRSACQFHWYNPGYASFEEFLETLNSRKRKSIRKERRRVQEAGVSFRRVEGADISTERWHDFYLFYQSTYAMRGMQGYLRLEFFQQLARSMPEQLFMIVAQRGSRDIAAALFFKNGTTLFGRYWGSRQDYQFLHFETCYYQGQDYAIEMGLKSFDSGAQGEHKIQRGFQPILTYSNHWIAHPGFAKAIAEFLEEERSHTQRYMASAGELLPYKKADD